MKNGPLAVGSKKAVPVVRGHRLPSLCRNVILLNGYPTSEEKNLKLPLEATSARERVPLQWTRTQMNRGNALRILGERKSRIAYLDASLEALRNAYHVYVKEAGQTQYESYFVGRMNEVETAIEWLKSGKEGREDA